MLVLSEPLGPPAYFLRTSSYINKQTNKLKQAERRVTKVHLNVVKALDISSYFAHTYMHYPIIMYFRWLTRYLKTKHFSLSPVHESSFLTLFSIFSWASAHFNALLLARDLLEELPPNLWKALDRSSSRLLLRELFLSKGGPSRSSRLLLNLPFRTNGLGFCCKYNVNDGTIKTFLEYFRTAH